jgi:hypothetical protein
MGAVSGMLDTYDTPNYVGQLIFATPADTPLLSMIGGMNGGKESKSVTFPVNQNVDNASAAQPAIVEGADTTYAGRSRAQVTNVVQVHQEGVKVSWTKQAATGQISGLAITNSDQPVMNEMDFQTELKYQKMARDIEYSYLQGTYTADTDISTARGTRGLATAISTNAVAASTATLGRSHFQSLWKLMADNGAPFNNVVLFANSFQRQIISDTYAYAPESRDVGGFSINQIYTDFGSVGIVFDRHMPTGSVFAVDLSVCAPVFLQLDDGTHVREKPDSVAGAYDAKTIYCETGLDYGYEKWHGKITGLATS